MFHCRLLVAVFLATLGSVTQALIVPQELPSLLSLVYSNIPPIRKGTDSRLGFGFRLGNHADFQVLVELGPQKDTRPIGMSDDSGSSKRQVNQNDYRKLRPTKEDPPITQNDIPKPSPSKEEPSSPGASWLQNWSNDMRGQKKKKRYPPTGENETSPKLGYVKTGTMIPESSLKQLQQLYKMATLENNPTDSSRQASLNIVTPRPTIRKTRGEIMEELMNVELD